LWRKGSSNTRGKNWSSRFENLSWKNKIQKTTPKTRHHKSSRNFFPNMRHWLGLEPERVIFLNFGLLRRSRCCLRELGARRVRVFRTREREEREEGLGTHWELGEHIGNLLRTLLKQWGRKVNDKLAIQMDCQRRASKATRAPTLIRIWDQHPPPKAMSKEG
jgi:hypothetical protein